MSMCMHVCIQAHSEERLRKKVRWYFELVRAGSPPQLFVNCVPESNSPKGVFGYGDLLRYPRLLSTCPQGARQLISHT